MEANVRAILRKLAEPPILVYPDWDAVADKSRPFRFHCNASNDGFGATPEQDQSDGSVHPILFISRATLDSERSWASFDLEAGSIVWAIERLRGHLWSTRFHIYSDHKTFEGTVKDGEHNARVRRWLESLSAYTYTLECRKGTGSGNADFAVPASPSSHRRRSHRTQPPHGPRYRRHLLYPLLQLRAERPSRPGYRLGWARIPPFKTRPNHPAAPLHWPRFPVTFLYWGHKIEHLTSVGLIATHASTARLLVGTENAIVNTGASPGSASRPSVISPPSTVGATESSPSGLISSRTRHRVAAAAETPRPTADYRFGR